MILITKEMSITALPCPLHAVFTMRFVYKGHIHQLYGFAMTSTPKREIPKTCLTNHKASISHPIVPLVINSLGGGHAHIQTLRTKAISRNQPCASQRLAHAW